MLPSLLKILTQCNITSSVGHHGSSGKSSRSATDSFHMLVILAPLLAPDTQTKDSGRGARISTLHM